MRASLLKLNSCQMRRIALLACTVALFLLPGASGQQPNAPGKKTLAPDETDKKKTSSRDFSLRVFALKYTDADSLKSVIAETIAHGRGGGAVAADPRTNSLIVRVATDDLVTIEQLVKELDVPAAEKRPETSLEMRVFKVKNVNLSKAVMQQLQIAVSNQGRVAIDPGRNFVVVHDTHEALAAFEALLNTLDHEPAPTRPTPGLRVRVVWLISGMERKDAAPAPGDLKSVLADLAKIGVEGLQLAAQTFVETVTNDEFQVESSPELDNPCHLSISGKFVTTPDELNTLQLRISAEEALPNSTRHLCNIRTTILAPPGRTVVLGATPVSKMTSVFTVQVISE